MLVLTRKEDQEILVPEYDIRFRVLRVEGKRIRIGVEAPRNVRIVRSEVDSPAEGRGLEREPDCLAPGYVWPLGVQFRPERAVGLSENRIKKKLPNRFEEWHAV